MKKIFLLIITGLFLNTFLFGQKISNEEFEEDSTLSDEIGIHAGFTTGVGFSYRHWMSKYGVQITALPVIAEDETFVSVGITVLYSLTERKNFRSFLYFGSAVYYNKYQTYYSTFDKEYLEEYHYNTGFGGGIEIGKYPKINIQVGYAAHNLTGKVLALPTIEVGFYFDIRRRR